ncbi:MAG: cell wall hydrolase/autolysin [Marmoricola sp.]|jgi:N-acetylmuramoyl-L-alanine amidase|nr:cell wall hydrolase/autolysin [Marmoricola sp.]
MRGPLWVVAAVLGATVGVVLPSTTAQTPRALVSIRPQSATVLEPARAARPLAGIVIALDPGHQLGNHNFLSQINRQVPAGGFTKPCNTTGTATNAGYPEATNNWRIANLMKSRLQALGATVALTRTTNSQQHWGPCVDVRGRFGKRVGARLMVSLHADGAPANDLGFHVIAPTNRKPWTSDIAVPSLRLAKQLRLGMLGAKLPQSTYIKGGLDIRSDLGTLNLSDVPVAMVEIGNMRNRSDAARMTSYRGRVRYANALVNGIRRYLNR